MTALSLTPYEVLEKGSLHALLTRTNPEVVTVAYVTASFSTTRAPLRLEEQPPTGMGV